MDLDLNRLSLAELLDLRKRIDEELARRQPPIRVGDKVRHKKYTIYGVGRVIGISQTGQRARVEFPETKWPSYYAIDQLERVDD